MNKRTATLLVMGIAAVLIIATATGIFQQPDYLSMDYPEVQIPMEEVHTIRITNADHDMTLRKEDDAWRLVEPIDAPVETPQVEVLLRRLDPLELSAMMTSEKSRYEEFGVTPEIGTRLDISWSGGRQQLMVAGFDQNYQGDYVIIGDDPRVFSLQRRYAITQDPQSWRDKRVSVLDIADMRSVTVTGGARNYTVLRDNDGTYSLKSGGDVNQQVAHRLFLHYTLFRADGFTEDARIAETRESPTLTIQIEHADGTTAIRMKDFNTFYAVVNDAEPAPFMITPVRIPVLAPTRADLTSG